MWLGPWARKGFMFLIFIQAPGLLVTLTTSKDFLETPDISYVLSKLHGYDSDIANILLQWGFTEKGEQRQV